MAIRVKFELPFFNIQVKQAMKKTIQLLSAVALTVTASYALAGTDNDEIRQRIQDRMNSVNSQQQQGGTNYQPTAESQKRFQERLNSVQDAAKALAKEAKDNDDTEANPVCEVVLCMFGKLKGASQSECKSAEKKYFDIIVKKRGKIRWGQTAKKRLDLLNDCPSPENDAINKKFGKVLG